MYFKIIFEIKRKISNDFTLSLNTIKMSAPSIDGYNNNYDISWDSQYKTVERFIKNNKKLLSASA